MTTFPGAPRLVKGALVSVDLLSLIPQVILFQYNPELLNRTVQPREGGDGTPGEVPRVAATPIETLRLEVLLDAADQLAVGGPAAALGLHPQLAALELLLY